LPHANGRAGKNPFDPSVQTAYVGGVADGDVNVIHPPRARFPLQAPLPRSYSEYMGRKLLLFLVTVQGLGAFALITIGVFFTKFRTARNVMYPAIRHELARSGQQLLPMFLFMSAALGLVVIGQAVSWLSKFGATNLLGPIMVVIVVRELGPLLTALLVLSRSGTTNVIELGTARALGEVEALEALGIDPVHYLVVPRVIGMALGIMSLTAYFIIGALMSGYLWAFLNDVPLRPGDYFAQLAGSLTGLDFAILIVKSFMFGAMIAIITCYHGLAQPLQLEEVSRATIRAVGQSIIACVLLDAVFIMVYIAARS
jgi:phospholipid/cholesterol/gamma-HCH transport system permease protein